MWWQNNTELLQSPFHQQIWENSVNAGLCRGLWAPGEQGKHSLSVSEESFGAPGLISATPQWEHWLRGFHGAIIADFKGLWSRTPGITITFTTIAFKTIKPCDDNTFCLIHPQIPQSLEWSLFLFLKAHPQGFHVSCVQLYAMLRRLKSL